MDQIDDNIKKMQLRSQFKVKYKIVEIKEMLYKMYMKYLVMAVYTNLKSKKWKKIDQKVQEKQSYSGLNHELQPNLQC